MRHAAAPSLAVLQAVLAALPCMPRPATAQEAQESEDPSLVVLVVVDQLRADLIDTWSDLFTDGFRRLADEGFRFENASHRHSVTETAAGHTTLSTGVHPSRHGIVANNWTERRDGEWQGVYAVEDPAADIVGHPEMWGRSPANLLRGGLADWVLANDPEARVLSVSGKDRASIPMAGRAPGEVYWLSTTSGTFVTSSWYAASYPAWVEDFNREELPTLLGDSIWTSGVPEAARARTRADTAADEADGVHTAFPHAFADEREEGWDASDYFTWLSRTPAFDAATLAFAERGMEELELGRRGSTDFLAVSFSSTDLIGHHYGPLSREQLDNLLRLDGVLGRLFDALDRQVGEGRWVLAFSADHGILTNPEQLAESGLDSRRSNEDDVARLRIALQTAAAEGTDDPPAFARRLARLAEELPFVAAAYPHARLAADAPPEPADSFLLLQRNSYRPGRFTGPVSRYGVDLRFLERFLYSTYDLGTSHGSPYWYDRSVPIVFLGAGVLPGRSPVTAYTVDVAPSLAVLGGVPTPPDLDGRPLLPRAGPARR